MIDKQRLAESIREAIDLSKRRRFKQSVELIVVLKGINPKAPEARFRDAIHLPKGLGKKVNICVVAEGDTAIKARESKADLVLTRGDIQNMSRKQAKELAKKCDWILVRADLMGIAGRILGPALGPRGKAPIPVPMNADISNLIAYYRSVTRFRNKEQPYVSGRIGSEDMSPEDLAENAMAVLSYIENKLKNPLDQVVKKVFVKTSMGYPIEVQM